MRVLLVNTSDRGGGAERVTWTLFEEYKRRGISSWLIVGRKQSHDPDVFVIPNDRDRGSLVRALIALERLATTFTGKVQKRKNLACSLHSIGEPARLLRKLRGFEDFDFPGSRKLLSLPPFLPDIVHCHNLHGGYFDLRVLSSISQQIPTVLTLHDSWLLTGHCAYSFDCERWKTGCGECPDLNIYPAIQRDATRINWMRKRNIFAKSRLYISTPSVWLMKRVEQSILAPAVTESRVIENGVDLSIFRSGDKEAARRSLGLPTNVPIALFVGNKIRGSQFKDFDTIYDAITRIGNQDIIKRLLFVCIGEEGAEEDLGNVRICYFGYQGDPKKLAKFYQSADVFLHAAKIEADTFPTTILEALSCGTPVVATDVGGIPEQIEDGLTGFLTPPGNYHVMAKRIIMLLENEPLRTRFSKRAAIVAQKRFDLNRQVERYLSWYEDILKGWWRGKKEDKLPKK